MPPQPVLVEHDRTTQIGDAVADLRTTARWTIAAAAAVGALLLGGAPLTSIGRVDGIGDAITAGAGLFVALIGVGWIVWHTTEALMPRIATTTQLDDPDMTSLRETIAREPAAFYGPFGTTPQHLRAAALLYDTAAANLAAALAREPDQTKWRVMEQALSDARANAELAHHLETSLLHIVHAWKVRSAVRRARLHTFTAAAVIAIGAVLFLTATN
jgi:hypothetical protein